MTKNKTTDAETITVSDEQPPAMVDIIKADDPEFPERATVAEDGLEHWLKQGWQLDT